MFSTPSEMVWQNATHQQSVLGWSDRKDCGFLDFLVLSQFQVHSHLASTDHCHVHDVLILLPTSPPLQEVSW